MIRCYYCGRFMGSTGFKLPLSVPVAHRKCMDKAYREFYKKRGKK